MICKHCKRDGIPETASFCCWCGKKLVKDKTEIKVPAPTVLPSGTYFNRIMVNGERVSISAATEKEYYTKARAAKAGLIEVKKAAPKMTLGTAIDQYLDANKNIISPSTYNAWKSYRKTRFIKYMSMDIGHIPWQKMISDEAADASGKTVYNAYDLVRHALDYVKVDRPVVKLPRRTKCERKWLDYSQIEQFCIAIEGKSYELAALLALQGLRRSELLHLTAEDIDAEKKLIRVRGASVIGEDNKLVDKDDNKTAESTRTVHIVIPRITELLEGKTGRLVTINPTQLYKDINSICKKHGLPEVGVHGLRHSFASLAYHLGWSEMTTMREGGWSNSKIVHEIYTHLAEQDANSDILRMETFFQTVGKNVNEIANETANA